MTEINNTTANNDKSSAIVSNVLLAGIIIAVIFMVTGLILYILNPTVMTNVPAITLKALPRGLKNLNPLAYFSAGIFMVILTPVCRVISLIIIFFWNKEYRYFLISALVLFIMVLSYMLAPIFME